MVTFSFSSLIFVFLMSVSYAVVLYPISSLQPQQLLIMSQMPYPAGSRCWCLGLRGGLRVCIKTLMEPKLVQGSFESYGRRKRSLHLLWSSTAGWFRAQKPCAWKPYCLLIQRGHGNYNTLVCTLV